jgi:hypothetical protein
LKLEPALSRSLAFGELQSVEMTPADDNKLDQPLRNNSRNNNYSNGSRMNDEGNNFQRDNNGRGGFSGGFRGGREGGGGGGMRGGGGFKNDDRRNHDNYDNRMDRGSNSMRGGGNYDDRRMSGRRMSRSRSRSPDFDGKFIFHPRPPRYVGLSSQALFTFETRPAHCITSLSRSKATSKITIILAAKRRQ